MCIPKIIILVHTVRADYHSTTPDCTLPEPKGQLVLIFVNFGHPLLQFQRALDWQALQEIIVLHWRQHGKNVDNRLGWSSCMCLNLRHKMHTRLSYLHDKEAGDGEFVHNLNPLPLFIGRSAFQSLFS